MIATDEAIPALMAPLPKMLYFVFSKHPLNEMFPN